MEASFYSRRRAYSEQQLDLELPSNSCRAQDENTIRYLSVFALCAICDTTLVAFLIERETRVVCLGELT